ncbi:hypothetical protein [Aureimonas sp. AU40]|uniref:hypothetical protein n=1 Tax=Aureimonas sp. AU40 TaxID=1637747 RepID=UPI0007813177|nr:hypothetical protein [Aureimonas sp. AU40]
MRPALVVLLVVASGPTAAAPGCVLPTVEVKLQAGSVPTRNLAAMSDGDLKIFLRGYADGLRTLPFLSVPAACDEAVKACLKARTDDERVIDLRRFMADNPGDFDNPAAVTVYEVVLANCVHGEAE